MKLISDGKPVADLRSKTKRFCLSCEYQVDLGDRILTVPKGYCCDLASVPQPLWWWSWGPHDLAAIAHDYILEYGSAVAIIKSKAIENCTFNQSYTKIEADKLFYEMCVAFGVTRISAILMYLAVRLFGRGNFE